MYQKFYGLTRNPFEVSPDPFFFYPLPCHTEALSILNYGVLRRKGIMVVTGEVGTGKTLLVRCLLDGLSRNQIAFAFVYNPMLSVLEFLSHVLTDLRVPSSAISKSEMLSRLNNFLVARAQRGQITALVVDEAQLLSWELLEEIRLLTNLETSEYKLLQIVLAGQPELDGKLDSHELRQLKQRIGLRCSLEPLKLKELSGYIYRRLELAGANSQGNAIFSDEAIDSIYLLSRGIPRLVNIICDNSMISGYGTQTKQITPDIIHSVGMDLRLNNATASPLLRPGDSKVLRSLFNVIEEL